MSDTEISVEEKKALRVAFRLKYGSHPLSCFYYGHASLTGSFMYYHVKCTLSGTRVEKSGICPKFIPMDFLEDTE